MVVAHIPFSGQSLVPGDINPYAPPRPARAKGEAEAAAEDRAAWRLLQRATLGRVMDTRED